MLIKKYSFFESQHEFSIVAASGGLSGFEGEQFYRVLTELRLVTLLFPQNSLLLSAQCMPSLVFEGNDCTKAKQALNHRSAISEANDNTMITKN